MKNLFILWSFILMGNLHAQCKYETIDYNQKKGSAFIQLKPITLDYYETPYNGRIILVTLSRDNNQYYLDIEITEDSATQDLNPSCFEKGTRLSFSLVNNEIVSLDQIEEEICGIKVVDDKTGFTSISNYTRFPLNQKAYEKLIKNKIVLLKIISKDYSKIIVLKEELEEVIEDKIIYSNPSTFFINYIDCLTNPKF